MIAHSTALESITVEVDSMSVAGLGAGASGKFIFLLQKISNTYSFFLNFVKLV